MSYVLIEKFLKLVWYGTFLYLIDFLNTKLFSDILNATNNPVGDIGTSYSPVLRMQKRNQTVFPDLSPVNQSVPSLDRVTDWPGPVHT